VEFALAFEEKLAACDQTIHPDELIVNNRSAQRDVYPLAIAQ
jgi:hypothetical protein